MKYYGDLMSSLIEELSRLPGIGNKSAQRVAFYIVNMPEKNVECLAKSIINARKNIKYCSICYCITDQDTCPICSNLKRDKTTIMVVEDAKDMVAYEKTQNYKGTYHVLNGVMSPMHGIGPESLKLKELLDRVRINQVSEIILATNANVEGEATAMYIGKLIKPLGVKVTRIAHGIPVGGNLEYVDEITLSRALEGRREM
ncbi:MAG TPA: recombination protein RecR [Clostridiales bacterium]|nr:MAG: recombination protein RecR [Clostridiales bacterium GWD2_32_59]HAN09411.1 recombination protein RecR [Clostridiales bacterium]